jgi:hypothetical protein
MYILKEILYLQSNISKVAGAEEVSLQSNTLSATSTESVHEDDSIVSTFLEHKIHYIQLSAMNKILNVMYNYSASRK